MVTAIALIGVVLLGALQSWTTRVNSLYFFGRTVPAGFAASAAGRRITRGYLCGVLTVTAVAVLLVMVTAHLLPHLRPGALVLLQAAAALAVFARANRQVQQEAPALSPDTAGTVIEVDLAETLPYWVPGLFAIVLPPAAVVAVFAWTMAQQPVAGAPARGAAVMAALEHHGMDMLFGLALGMLSASFVMQLLFRYSARLRTRMAQYTVRAFITLEWVGSALANGLLLASHTDASVSRTSAKAVTGLAVAAAVAVMVWNQSRAQRFVPAPLEQGDDDRWRWGLFYVDRNDPALFVQSRCGAGYGLNYGRMLAWPITLALCAYLVFSLVYLPHRA